MARSRAETSVALRRRASAQEPHSPQPGDRPRARIALEALLAAAGRATDPDLASVMREDASLVQASLVAVILKVALSAALRDAEAADHGSDVATRIARTEQRVRDAGAASRSLVGPPWSALDDTGNLNRWLDRETAIAVVTALAGDAPADAAHAGAVHEELLTLAVRRLRGTAVALRPDGAWVTAKDVLAEPRDLRSKWLQRMFALPKSAVAEHAAALARADTEAAVLDALAPLRLRGTAEMQAGALVVDVAVERRRSGAHYTPEALAQRVVARALGPLVEGASSERIRALGICDPAMGSGAFLAQAALYLADALVGARRREGRELSHDAALRAVVTECLHGVDKDPIAADLARATVSHLATRDGQPSPDLSRRLVVGDALVDTRAALSTSTGFDWRAAFPAVFDGAGGFDACVGNPPWVAYVGRAAQPLDPALADYYERTNPAFRAYKTLHGLFVRRAAELLRPGGRLGLVLPTSVADLDGYGPTRVAHDELCGADPELYDFGDGAFEGVFQPCMALTSTRRAEGGANPPAARIWQLGRSDLDAVETRLLERLERLPKLAAELFGERGFQTTGDDLAHLRRQEGPEPPFTVPIREGSDISEFRRAAPRTYLNPEGLRGRLRDAAEFRGVGVLIRQTARYPIATLSDGAAFRNSILAGFANDDFSAPALAAYLNSNVARFYHYARHRDARQGMPQLKIGHLRALPDVRDRGLRERLHGLGSALGNANAGVGAEERKELERLVGDAFELDAAERDVVERFASRNPLPVPRRTSAAT